MHRGSRGVPGRRRVTGHRRRVAVLGALIVVLAGGVPLALSPTSGPAAASTSTSVVLVGHGYGHGIGMGQWGSLGYALGDDGGAGNFTYGQILSHYYGGTTWRRWGRRPRRRPSTAATSSWP